VSVRYKNVLFFSMEDLNDWIGPLKGHPDCHTPNLDRFATNARVFERAYTEAPACSPSRTAMLFSTHPWTSGILHNDLNWYDFFQHGKSQSLISQFKQNGFETLGWGKVFHSRFERHSLDLTDWDRFTFQDGGLPASARKMALQFSQNGIDLADCGEYNDFLRS